MHPIASHPPDRLRFGHPDWVRSLSRGAGVAGWGLALGAAAWVAGGVAPSQAAYLVCGVAAMVGGAGLLFGAWLLSCPDPNGSTPLSDAGARWALRLTLAAATAGGVLRFASDAKIIPLDLVTPAFLVTLAAGAIDVAGRLTFLHYARRLALRLPDAGLAARLVSMVPAYGLALVAMATFDALRLVPMLERLAPAAAVALAVVTFVLLKHLRQLRRGMQIQTDYARGIWSRGPAARPSAAGLAP
jgi:hypothetical protein